MCVCSRIWPVGGSVRVVCACSCVWLRFSSVRSASAAEETAACKEVLRWPPVSLVMSQTNAADPLASPASRRGYCTLAWTRGLTQTRRTATEPLLSDSFPNADACNSATCNSTTCHLHATLLQRRLSTPTAVHTTQLSHSNAPPRTRAAAPGGHKEMT